MRYQFPVTEEPVPIDFPLVVLIRISWASGKVWNVVASCTPYRLWYVTGLARPCHWKAILPCLLGSPEEDRKSFGPCTVSVTQLL